MWLEIAAGAFLGANALYQILKGQPQPKPIREFVLPRQDPGATWSLIYGRCRVKEPVCAWVGLPTAHTRDFLGGSTPEMLYGLDMFFTVGMPFSNGTQKLHRIWAGEARLAIGGTATDELTYSSILVSNFEELTGEGGGERQPLDDAPLTGRLCVIRSADQSNLLITPIAGEVEFLNGNSEQKLVGDAPTYPAATLAGQKMLDSGIDGAEIPGFRNLVCVLLSKVPFLTNGLVGLDGFCVGRDSPSVPAFSFEISSYPVSPLGPSDRITRDANPIDVIYDLLTGRVGRLGLPVAAINLDNFRAAAVQLAAEGHGYSGAIEDSRPASEAILDILRQIDGVLYEDSETGKIAVRLVRDDYAPASLPVIEPSTCEALRDYSQCSWTGRTNRVVVTYTNSQAGFTDASETAENHANAVGGDNEINEVVRRFPGCHEAAIARTLAARELRYLSRPLAKCRALGVSRALVDLGPAAPVRVRWPEYGIDRVFRIASVDRGTLQDSKLVFDLVEDIYQVRGAAFTDTHIPSWPTEIEA